MVVVILIGILTMMAVPSMAVARYNAKTLDDATRIAELYREGRTRSIGRGSATLLQMSSANAMAGRQTSPAAGNGGLGFFQLFEAQIPGTGAGGGALTTSLPLPGGSPISSCALLPPTVTWATVTSPANAVSTLIDEVDLNGVGEAAAEIWTTLQDGSGGAINVGSLCYTPLGRAYYQANAAPVFTAGANLLHGDLQISVQRSGKGGPVTGITRTVIVPDSGSTRIVSR